MKEECNNCIYNKGNECRRYPPTVEVISGLDIGVIPNVYFPAPDSNSWCGEWKSKNE